MQGSVSYSITVAGISIQATLRREAETGIGTGDIALPAGKAGALTTRTSDTAGVATLSAGHGITTGTVVDVYWAAGVRYGMTTTVAGTAVTLGAGAGDVLPAQDTAVILSPQTTINLDFDGDDIELIAMHSTKRGHVVFEDVGDAVLMAQELVDAGPWMWAADMGAANPLTGNPVDEIKVSNGTTAAAVFKLGLILDTVA